MERNQVTYQSRRKALSRDNHILGYVFSGLAVLLIASCTLPNVDPDFEGLPADTDPKTFTCCEDPERQPLWFVDLGFRKSEEMAPFFSGGENSGLLAGLSEAQSHISSRAQPFDILVFSSKSQMSSRMLAGWFTHSAIYFGTEAQLKALGLWSHPAVKPHQAAIRAGKIIAESNPEGVHLSSLADILNEKDAVALLRPDISRAAKSKALDVALSAIGSRFDHYYDLETCDEYACSELICKSLPSLNFPVREIYGRWMLVPDDIAARAIRGEGLQLVDYVRATRNGTWSANGAPGAMNDVAAFWGPMSHQKAEVKPYEELGQCTL